MPGATMTLLEKCQKWHEKKEYNKIINAITALPESEKNANTDLELARAYNNIANPDTIEGQLILQLSINLLLKHIDELNDNYHFNFRLAYAFYYLDNPIYALKFFKKAYELHDSCKSSKINSKKDIKFFIDDCLRLISLPLSNRSLKDKVYECLDFWCNNKNKLDNLSNNIDAFNDFIDEILSIAFTSCKFNCDIKDNKYTITLLPEKSKANLFKYIYFKNIFNEYDFDKYQINIGYQKNDQVFIKIGRYKITLHDINIFVTGIENKSLYLKVYSEKLKKACKDNNELYYENCLELIQQALGDEAFLIYVTQIDIIDEPFDNSISLADLYLYIKNEGLELVLSDQDIINTFSHYTVNPDLIPKSNNKYLRHDILLGTTNHGDLTSSFLVEDNSEFFKLYQDCAIAGFVCCKLDEIDSKDNLDKFIDIKDDLAKFLDSELTSKEYWLSGYAFGLNYGYFDFIAWDLHAVVTALIKYTRIHNLSQVAFHVFNSDANTISLGDSTFTDNFVIDQQFLTQIEPFSFYEINYTAALTLDPDSLKLKKASNVEKIKFLEEKVQELLKENFNAKYQNIRLDSTENLLCIYSHDKKLLHDLAILLKKLCDKSSLFS